MIVFKFEDIFLRYRQKITMISIKNLLINSKQTNELKSTVIALLNNTKAVNKKYK